VYDPCTGDYVWEQTQVPTVPFAVKNNNVLGLNPSFLTQLQVLDKACGYADFRKKYPAFSPPERPCGGLTGLNCDIYGLVCAVAYASNPCFNIYEISGQYPLQSDPFGYPTGL
jgi:carboxypeptidase D